MKNISLLLLTIEDKFVLFKRSKKNKYFKNKFGLIGGMRNINETNIDCIKRESFEEIGFIPNNINYLNSYNYYDKKLNVFYVEINNLKQINLNCEHIEYKLFSHIDLDNENIVETTKIFVHDLLIEEKFN